MACILVPTVGNADLVIDIGDVTIPAGGTGSVDVMITSNGAQPLTVFGVEFLITANDGTELWFAVPQNSSQVTAPDRPDPLTDYVFLSTGSAGISGPATAVVDLTQTTYVGLDTSDDDVNGVSGSFTSLLVTLDLTTVGIGMINPAVAGNTFTIALVDSANTFFLTNVDLVNLDGEPIPDGYPDDIPFTSTQGTVTISAATGVPEPSSLVLAACALGGATWFRGRRRRNDATTAA